MKRQAIAVTMFASAMIATRYASAGECSYSANPEPARVEVRWSQPEGETDVAVYPAGEIIVTRKGLKPLFGCLSDIEGKRLAELAARPGLGAAARCLPAGPAADAVSVGGSLLEGAAARTTLERMPAHLKDLAMWCGATAKAHFGEEMVIAFPEPGPLPADAGLDTLLLSSLVAQLASAPAKGERGADAVAAEILKRRDVEVVPFLLTQVNSTKSSSDGDAVQRRARQVLHRLLGDAAYAEALGPLDAERYDLNEALGWFNRVRADLQRDWAARWRDENPSPCP